MSVYDIRPYEGIGPLALGMSPAEVHAVLGSPRNTVKNSLGERSENYPHLTATYSKDADKLVELGINSRADVHFRGAALFTDPAAIDMLVAADGAPLTTVGFIVFLSLGIVLGDFDSDQGSDRVVSIFERGRWDGVESLEPYNLQNG